MDRDTATPRRVRARDLWFVECEEGAHAPIPPWGGGLRAGFVALPARAAAGARDAAGLALRAFQRLPARRRAGLAS